MTFAQTITPRLTLTVDDSLCIVLESTDERGNITRHTITNTSAFKTALSEARAYVRTTES